MVSGQSPPLLHGKSVYWIAWFYQNQAQPVCFERLIFQPTQQPDKAYLFRII